MFKNLGTKLLNHFLLLLYRLRFTDTANRTVTESIVKEVRGQFPHFTEEVKCKCKKLENLYFS